MEWARFSKGLSNNSVNRSGISLLLIVNLPHDDVDSHPVNSSPQTPIRVRWMMKELEVQERVNWRAVAFYYLVACALSWPFFWWRDIYPESWFSWQFPMVSPTSPLTFILKMAIIMWGPGMAAILSFIIFRKTHRRTITFWGTSWSKSLAFYWVPILFAVAVGVPMPDGSINRLGTAALGLVTLFTILGEELGWRGFLQDALRPLGQLKRYVLIGVLWEFWHFTNRTSHGSLKQIVLFLAIFYPAGIILSCLIGEATERGKSLLIAVTLHAWLDIVFTFPGMRTYIALMLSIIFWVFLLMRWNKDKVEAPNNSFNRTR